MVQVAAVLLALAVVAFTVQASIMSAVHTHGAVAPGYLRSPRALLPAVLTGVLSALVLALSALSAAA